MLLDLSSDQAFQAELAFDDAGANVCTKGRDRLMGAMDLLNERFGRSTVHIASTGLAHGAKQWDMKLARRTPAYTTRCDEVAVVRA